LRGREREMTSRCENGESGGRALIAIGDLTSISVPSI